MFGLSLSELQEPTFLRADIHALKSRIESSETIIEEIESRWMCDDLDGIDYYLDPDYLSLKEREEKIKEDLEEAKMELEELEQEALSFDSFYFWSDQIELQSSSICLETLRKKADKKWLKKEKEEARKWRKIDQSLRRQGFSIYIIGGEHVALKRKC